ncbi:hypothetical protein ACTA71_011252 [Dictyostelium dimigraforme]
MIKRNLIILLLVNLFFIIAIKSSSSSVQSLSDVQKSLELIVDGNSQNQNTKQCGTTLENACKNINEAIIYFKSLNSPISPLYNSLILKLVDGTYPISTQIKVDDYWYLTMSPYTDGSKNVIIDGRDMKYTFMDISTFYSVKISISNINFINFDGNFLYYIGLVGTAELDISFSNCKFSNCENFGFYANTYTNKSGSLKFINSIFEKVTFKSLGFYFPNVNIEFISTQMKTVTFEDGFSWNGTVSISSSTFNDITSNSGLFYSLQKLSIMGSTFNNINILSNYYGLINAGDSSLEPYEIKNNIFTNVQGTLLKVFNATIKFNLNKISNDQTNSVIFDISRSNISLDSNTFEISNIFQKDTIKCLTSSITFTNNNGNFIKTSFCRSCEISYNGEKLCESYHPNGSVDSKSISYHLLFIVLILISLLNH